MSYPGGKGGLFRQLINLIPAHSTYIESHLGNGAVLRHKTPVARSLGLEVDDTVIERWADASIPGFELIQQDATSFLRSFPFTGNEFVYADPPYVPASRRRTRVYRHELDEQAHGELLDVLDAIPAKVMLSGYGSPLYDQRLAHWNRIEFDVGSHGLRHREVVWLNYESPAVPCDLRFIGSTFRERQRIRRKQERMQAKIRELPASERALLMQWLAATYGSGEGAAA